MCIEIASKNVHRRFNILPNIKVTCKQLPNIFKMLPLWRNFVKSGHTAVLSEWVSFNWTNVGDFILQKNVFNKLDSDRDLQTKIEPRRRFKCDAMRCKASIKSPSNATFCLTQLNVVWVNLTTSLLMRTHSCSQCSKIITIKKLDSVAITTRTVNARGPSP